MRIKTFYQFNEGIGSSIRSVFNKDEETVEGIIKNASKLKKSDIIEVEIIDYVFGGKGIAKINLDNNDNKFVVFVDSTYPGDKVLTEIKKVKKNYAEGKLVEVIEKSQYRVEAVCEHYGICGGCKSLDLNYHYQLK